MPWKTLWKSRESPSGKRTELRVFVNERGEVKNAEMFLIMAVARGHRTYSCTVDPRDLKRLMNALKNLFEGGLCVGQGSG